MAIAIAAFLLAFVLSYLLTPLIRYLAMKVGFVDRPDGGRKLQSKPVALGGGLSLIIATPLAIGVIWWLMGKDAVELLGYNASYVRSYRMIISISTAAVILMIVGLVDDGIGMKGSHKLLFQFIAATLVAGIGLQVNQIDLLGKEFSLGYLGTLAAVIWLLASINSFNLIDGVDGLAGSVGVVFCLAVGSLSLVRGHSLFDPILVFSLAGAILGFLRYNFAPASIYMGDTGSMLVGLILGAITLRISTKQAATVAFVVPLAIWAIPIFDSFAAVVRRKLTGRSIYTTDRGHFHHVLLTRGMNSGQAVAFITSMCAITSIAAVASVVLEKSWIGFVAVILVIGFLIFSRVFGHVEFLLLNSRILGMGQVTDSIDANARQSTIARKGHIEWDSFWDEVVGKADEFDIVKLSLHLTMTEIGEDFFATWTRAGHNRRDVTWSLDLPFIFNDLSVGRLKVSGLQSTENSHSNVIPFMREVERMEEKLYSRMRQHDGYRPENDMESESPARNGNLLPSNSSNDDTKRDVAAEDDPADGDQDKDTQTEPSDADSPAVKA